MNLIACDSIKYVGILMENNQNQTNLQSISGCGATNMVETFCVPTIQNQPGEISKRNYIDLAPSISAVPNFVTSTSVVPELAASSSATPDLSVHSFEIIKKLKNKCQKQSMKIKRLNEKVRRQTKCYYAEPNNLFDSGDCEHDTNHKYLLIKSVIEVYMNLRYKYYGKKSTERISHINYLNKIVLFRNE